MAPTLLVSFTNPRDSGTGLVLSPQILGLQYATDVDKGALCFARFMSFLCRRSLLLYWCPDSADALVAQTTNSTGSYPGTVTDPTARL